MDDIGAASKHGALRPLDEDGASKVIVAYLLAEADEYRRLSELRQQAGQDLHRVRQYTY